MRKYKVIFIGTSEFALPCLEKLIRADFVNVASVITQPDKPAGRKGVLTPPPVKLLAQKYKIPILQPNKIINLKSKIKNQKSDLIVLVSYGQIIPKEILDIPKYGCLNVHPSLLPKYRGASPIQTAILNGDKETGVTIMLMDEKMDHGPILAQREWEIPNPKSQIPNKFQISNSQITYLTLSKQLAELGAELLIEILSNYLSGKIKPRPQDHSKATFTKILKKENGRIDWHESAQKVERMIRAFYPWPGAFTFWNQKRMKIISAEVSIEKFKKGLKPGQVFLTEGEEMATICGRGVLVIKKLQIEGKDETRSKDFLLGRKEILGSRLN